MSGRRSSDSFTAYGVSKFPHKLWTIINDCDSGAIAWDKNGHTILIHEALFLKQYLDREPHHRIFKTINFESFVRSLNLYGFRKVSNHQRRQSAPGCPKPSKESRLHEFQCDLFVQGRPDLLVGMRRNVGVKVKREVAARTKVCGLLEEDGPGQTRTPQRRPAAPAQPPAPAPAPAHAPVCNVTEQPKQICQNGQWYELLASSPSTPADTPTKPASAATTGGLTWVRVAGPPQHHPTQHQVHPQPLHAGPRFHHPGGGDCGAEMGQPPAWVSRPPWPGPGGDVGEAFTVLQEEDGTTRIGEKEFHNLVNAISDVIRQNPDAWTSFLRYSGMSAQPLPVSPEQRLPPCEPLEGPPAWRSHPLPPAPPCTIPAAVSYLPPQHWPAQPPPTQPPTQGPPAPVTYPVEESYRLETEDPLGKTKQPPPQQQQEEEEEEAAGWGRDLALREEERGPQEEDCSPISVV